MKKRVLSMLLAFILCFSTLPMTAFAQEALQEADAVTEQEEQQEAAPAAEPEELPFSAALRTSVVMTVFLLPALMIVGRLPDDLGIRTDENIISPTL